MRLLTSEKNARKILKRMDDESLLEFFKELENWEKELKKYVIDEINERGLKLN
jgi:hypothetical protein